jgi:hypothetical protein
MKKFLISAIMLVTLSFTSFAIEVKEKEEKDSFQIESKNVTYVVDVSAYCGMTSCGVPYCFTTQGEMRENREMAITMWDLADAFFCQS